MSNDEVRITIQSNSSVHVDLRSYLETLVQRFDELSNEEINLISEMYMKHKLLQSNQRVETNDWDYISLGIYLKELARYTNTNQTSQMASM